MAKQAPVPQNDRLIQQLRQLGLTRTEAEVYLATLRAAGGAPISAYKVAQTMGRDPANLGKTLAALEKRGAVRLVQDRPRLYLAVPPSEFTESLINDFQKVGEDLVAELALAHEPQPSGLTLALPTDEAALEQARILIQGTNQHLLAFGPLEIFLQLWDDLTAKATEEGVSVRLLGVEDGTTVYPHPDVDLALVPMNAGLSHHCPSPWLQMATDGRRWLQVLFQRSDAHPGPAGWWAEDLALAGVATATLDHLRTAIGSGPRARANPEDRQSSSADKAAPERDSDDSQAYTAGILDSIAGLEEDSPATAPGVDPSSAMPAPPPPEEPASVGRPDVEKALPEDEEQDGADWDFVVRHEEDEEEGK
jgi:sugar-specific transcriptional regulator TrmB